MKKVLVLGNNGSAFAVGAAYQRSGARLFVYGERVNPGFLHIAEEYEVGDLTDLNGVAKFALKVKPDFVFIGTADSLSAGMADHLFSLGIPSVGPLKAAAQLEASKAFTRTLFEKYQIPGNINYKIFYNEKGMEEFVKELNGNFVVKADGLMFGLGVKVSGDHFMTMEEGLSYARECLQNAGRVVLEEKLIGQEFSLMSFCDGHTLVHMPLVQDFKRAFDDDKGPNTGGMGTYTDVDHSLPFVLPEELKLAQKISCKVAEAVKQEVGVPFQGILFGGFMVTSRGLRVLEYNNRFGDPEGINLLSLLKTNFVDLSEALIQGRLADVKVEFENKASVCKYLVPEGYPDRHQDGKQIEIGLLPRGAEMYTAWVKEMSQGWFLAAENGVIGRAIAFLAKGDSLEAAEQLVEQACETVKGPVFHRKDIAKRDLIQQRVEMMNLLRTQ